MSLWCKAENISKDLYFGLIDGLFTVINVLCLSKTNWQANTTPLDDRQKVKDGWNKN